ncbi:MAG TPA: type ISP restriction/modification enzyme, partial [Methylomirabilota bacterium]|nr:type ISP restriction/modification enzyme [Methylomirabilota bacterium]
GVSLDQTEHSEQLKRYLGSLANLILTDYVEFRWYVSGEHRQMVRLAKVGANRKLVVENGGVEKLSDLLQGFRLTHTPTINNPKELAIRMAALAQLIRNAITLAFESEEGGGSLHSQMVGFKQVLLPDLDNEQFADMYAQTICYGLFAARCNTNPGITFTREHAAYDIPKTNPFLRKMFSYIAGPDLDERIVWVVDDLAELLNRSDMASILQDFGKRTRQEDPVVHFYETFLAQYDPKLREMRGVYYTPEPVVSYIVRSVDYVLKKVFELPDGLADYSKINMVSSDGKTSIDPNKLPHTVQILDPATGTGTFLYYVIKQIYESFKNNMGIWSSYVSEHLLPRLFGFELLMAPYAVAHLKLGLQLGETGYDFGSNERLGVYLTNTLEEEFEASQVLFADWLVEEATAAGNVKYDAPVMVVLGNPPYSGHSANTGKWISELLHDKPGNYFEVDGKPLGERQPKWLNDDYVKFIRFAQWRIERTGYGILAFITNHGYLDNPTFRGMRQSLMQSFDEIYVLDLHGNAKKKERSPDGTIDQNVFDIQQGVAIGIFVKKQKEVEAPPVVYHAHLWGPREVFGQTSEGVQLVGGKYHWLSEHDVTTTEWSKLEPNSPFYLFIPQDEVLREEYQAGWKMTEAMPSNNVGFVTARDKFAIDFDEISLRRRIENFRKPETEITNREIEELYNLKNTTSWMLPQAREHLRANNNWSNDFKKCLYRAFDTRYIYYSTDILERPVYQINRHMLAGENIGLITNRQVNDNFQHILCTDKIINDCTLSLETRERSYLFPLYLYSESSHDELFEAGEFSTAPNGRLPNFSSVFIADISKRLNQLFVSDGKGDLQQTFGPEDIFNYMYAVFHSPTYRTRYSEFLKSDFPRLPLTSNPDLFRELCAIGNRLVELHLMEQYGKQRPNYPVDGNNIVEKVEYTKPTDNPDQGHVWINKTQYFDGVPPDVWKFHVGGYQVCHKWLKDRKGRQLDMHDVVHYERIVAALAETITLMEQIDETIEMG